MTILTTVTISSGISVAGDGTVSTLDNFETASTSTASFRVAQAGSWSITGTTIAATQSGTWSITGSTIAATQSGTWNIGTITSVTSVSSATVTQATTFAVAGDIANAAADSGNPLKMGGVGHTANPTAVTDGQRVNAAFDKLGKQVVVQ